MASIAERLRKAILGPAQKRFKKRLEGLEERSTTPTEAEKVVVRPDRKVKRRKKRKVVP